MALFSNLDDSFKESLKITVWTGKMNVFNIACLVVLNNSVQTFVFVFHRDLGRLFNSHVGLSFSFVQNLKFKCPSELLFFFHWF